MALKNLRQLALITLPITSAMANESKRYIMKELIAKGDESWLDKTISACGYGRDRRIFNAIKIESGTFAGVEG